MNKPLLPLWALMLGPIWIIVFFVMYMIYSLVFVLWIMPTTVACGLFGWSVPKCLTPSCFGDEYEMMP
jgi:hypothetical protein